MNSSGQGLQEIRRIEATIDQSEIIKALQDLELVQVKLGDTGYAASLQMMHCRAITDDAMQLIVKLSTLTRVTLWPMTDQRLAYFEFLPNLEHADFRNLSYGTSAEREHITDAGVRHLSELYGLEALYLS